MRAGIACSGEFLGRDYFGITRHKVPVLEYYRAESIEKVLGRDDNTVARPNRTCFKSKVKEVKTNESKFYLRFDEGYSYPNY